MKGEEVAGRANTAPRKKGSKTVSTGRRSTDTVEVIDDEVDAEGFPITGDVDLDLTADEGAPSEPEEVEVVWEPIPSRRGGGRRAGKNYDPIIEAVRSGQVPAGQGAVMGTWKAASAGSMAWNFRQRYPDIKFISRSVGEGQAKVFATFPPPVDDVVETDEDYTDDE